MTVIVVWCLLHVVCLSVLVFVGWLVGRCWLSVVRCLLVCVVVCRFVLFVGGRRVLLVVVCWLCEVRYCLLFAVSCLVSVYWWWLLFVLCWCSVGCSLSVACCWLCTCCSM